MVHVLYAPIIAKISPSINLSTFWLNFWRFAALRQPLFQLLFGFLFLFLQFDIENCIFFAFFASHTARIHHTHILSVVNIVVYVYIKIGIMQISENLLRVIFMLSTIVAVTDCCSSRLLLLKEHTLQIVQQHRLRNAHVDDYDYEHEDYEQLQKQQNEQQQQQQQKIPQYVDIFSSGIEFLKNLSNEYARSRDDEPAVQEENTTDTQLLSGTMDVGDFGSDSFQSLLGIFDAAAFETTTKGITTTTATTATSAQTTTATIETGSSQSTLTATTTKYLSESSAPASIRSTIQSESIESIEPSSTTSATTTTTVHTIGSDGMESVMNDLKTGGDLLSLPCSGQFKTAFCLNRGRCFRYPIGNDTIHSCICADGYIGERCESKSMNGSFKPFIAGANKKQKILMARIVFSFPMLLALSVIYIMIGAAIVFKRPSPSTALTTKDQFELMTDDDAGELIMMNSLPIVEPAITYSTLME